MTRRSARFPAGIRAAVVVEAFMPDRRMRDLDNLFKSLLDALVLSLGLFTSGAGASFNPFTASSISF